ncbi:Paladin [Bagarius yarrelli]|uniref:Paladin n=1 Tax=Bagarius yarrelli TaxID=175774 RepID=A0A556VVM0_BAGYA|nr:Paladin [Bagarius yarrelli]
MIVFSLAVSLAVTALTLAHTVASLLAFCGPVKAGCYFMVQDVYSKVDVLNTTASCGAPNFRQVKGGLPVFGMGQPSLRGFKQVLYTLQSRGYELHDFARLNENTFYIYNDIEHFKAQPQRIIITCEEDIHVTEEVYKRPMFTLLSYRYHRLPLPVEGAPLEEQFDAFVTVLREIPSLSVKGGSCPPPALLFSCQVGVGRTNVAMILGTLVMERVKENTEPSPSTLDEENWRSEVKVRFRVIEELVCKLSEGQQVVDEAVGMVLEYLADERRRYSAVLWKFENMQWHFATRTQSGTRLHFSTEINPSADAQILTLNVL